MSSNGDIYTATLDVFRRRSDPSEPLTSSEVAAALDAERRTVYERLQTLSERGELDTKKVGSGARVWWIPDERRPGSVDDTERPYSWDLDRLFDASGDIFYVLDRTGDLLWWNDRLTDVTGYSDREIQSMNALDFFADADQEVVSDAIGETFSTGEVRIEVPFLTSTDERIYHEFVAIATVGADGEDRLVGIGRNVADRVRREDTIAVQNRQLRTIVENIPVVLFALDDDGVFTLSEGKGLDVLGLEPGEVVGESVFDVYAESPHLIRSLSMALAGNQLTVIHQFEDVWWKTWLRPIGEGSGNGERVIGVAIDVTERVEHEWELQSQREHLAALKRLNDVVREITEAVIEESTREAIEAAVCERLAASDSYEFAWIAEVDPDTSAIIPRVERGVDGYLDGIDLSADPDTPEGRGPAGQAVRTGEIQVSSDVRTDPAFEPWVDVAREYGYRSFAAIPVVSEGTLYGLLGVYSTRVGAFDREERAVVGQLGEVVGHAIEAVEQKQALLSDEVVELVFRSRRFTDRFGLRMTDDTTLTLDRTVPLGGGEFLAYCTAGDDGLAAVETLIESEQVPFVESTELLERTGATTRFVVRLSDPPAFSAIVEANGVVDEAVVTDGDLRLTVHLHPNADVGAVADTVTSEMHETEMIARHQRTVGTRSPRRVAQVLSEDLTNRQAAALEVAYFSGFFEWPRTCSGEEVADSLGVGASTFHQHLRKAERKLLDVVFDEL